jgi:hypothetical protein
MERQDAVALAARLAQVCFGELECRAGARHLGAKRLGIDAKQEVACRDACTFVITALEQDP